MNEIFRGWVAAAALFAACGGAIPMAPPVAPPPPPPRFTFRLPALSGGTISSEDFKGRVLVVDVWATWCGPCKMVIPHLIDLQSRFGGKGVSVLGLNSDGDPGAGVDPGPIKEFVLRAGINYPVGLIDERTYRMVSRLAGGESGGLSIPTTLIIGRDGRLLRVYPGYYHGQEKDIERLLTSLLERG
jgi:thiol-disulfide isomerase/thioredoxin